MKSKRVMKQLRHIVLVMGINPEFKGSADLYEIPLAELQTGEQIERWIKHLSEKTWMTGEMMGAFKLEVGYDERFRNGEEPEGSGGKPRDSDGDRPEEPGHSPKRDSDLW